MTKRNMTRLEDRTLRLIKEETYAGSYYGDLTSDTAILVIKLIANSKNVDTLQKCVNIEQFIDNSINVYDALYGIGIEW